MPDSDPRTRRQELENFVAGRVVRIQRAYLESSRPDGAAALAELRRSGTEPGSSPTTWTLEFEDFPETLVGSTHEPSRGERAAHLAFTLYAIHQQSQTEPMHKPGLEHSLGRAVHRLGVDRRQSSDTTVLGQPPTRFAALGTASTFEEVGHYARQLVTQLRAAGIALDYGRLAGQLYELLNPWRADAVRLQWGREFAGASTLSTDTSTSDQKED